MNGGNAAADEPLSDVVWLNTDEQAAWRGFLESTRHLFAVLENQLQSDSDMLFGHYDVLVNLSEAPQRTLRMGALAARVQSSPSRLSHTMNRLEQLGWVRREALAGDRRAAMAILTDEGAAALAAAAPGHVTAVRQHLISRLTPDQLAQLQIIAKAITAATGQ